ncbi:MAG: amino acid permease [Cyclobacteriaceae bacterium]|nr:amino acid permease [Cyclobacteriaceae bacterium]
MYLRFGWVVGNVGLLGSFIIVTISTGITFLTALSIASISTDKQVKGGGAYYMISRSLGIETGGAIGIPLYMAQALSVSLYTIGFAESVSLVFTNMSETAVGLIVTVLIGILALLSAKIAVRSQYFVMAAIAISLLSLVFGQPLEESSIELWGVTDSESENFWTVFAVFFPAVTGIMAGVNMSGNLKNPSKAIPNGTFAAVGTGYLIYMLIPFILASRVDAINLVLNPLIMRQISLWGDAILLGVWGATLSSAMGSMLGAPRILQAMARDGVLPEYFRWLGRGTKKDDTPRVGTLFTMGLAMVAVYFGNLNIIAPILTMFFLATYGMLNVSAGIEKFVGSPSFRPKFKVHWGFSLLGFFGCVGVMLLINPLATAIAVIFLIAVFIWLERRGLRSTWGDIREGIWLSLIRLGLLNLDSNVDPKNWRPHIMVLSGAPSKRWNLITLTNDIIHNRGLMTVATVLSGNKAGPDRIKKMENNIREYLENRGVVSLVRVISARDAFQGAERLVETYGLGSLVPNTILLGDSTIKDHYPAYCKMVHHFYQSRRNVIIVREDVEKNFGNMQFIDIWWGGLRGNGALMIIISHLLQRSIPWNNARIRLNMVVNSDHAAREAQKNISELLSKVRIKIEDHVIEARNKPFADILRDESVNADLIIMGLAEPGDDFLSYYEQLINVKTKGIGSTLFVLAGQEINFEDVLL